MSRLPLWRLAPWTRAPWLGLRQPAAVIAVLVTSAILACAVASAPLFLSTRSAALQQQLSQRCDEVPARRPASTRLSSIHRGSPRTAVTAAPGRSESGLRGPVVPVAVAGALLALVLVAAAGSF